MRWSRAAPYVPPLNFSCCCARALLCSPVHLHFSSTQTILLPPLPLLLCLSLCSVSTRAHASDVCAISGKDRGRCVKGGCRTACLAWPDLLESSAPAMCAPVVRRVAGGALSRLACLCPLHHRLARGGNSKQAVNATPRARGCRQLRLWHYGAHRPGREVRPEHGYFRHGLLRPARAPGLPRRAPPQVPASGAR